MADTIDITGDGTSDAIRIGGGFGASRSVPPRPTVHLWSAAWQGATAKIEYSATGEANSWGAITTDNTHATDYSATKNSTIRIDADSGFFRVVVSGSGSPEPVISVDVSEG